MPKSSGKKKGKDEKAMTQFEATQQQRVPQIEIVFNSIFLEYIRTDVIGNKVGRIFGKKGSTF